jgi:hypothetical protein
MPDAARPKRSTPSTSTTPASVKEGDPPHLPRITRRGGFMVSPIFSVSVGELSTGALAFLDQADRSFADLLHGLEAGERMTAIECVDDGGEVVHAFSTTSVLALVFDRLRRVETDPLSTGLVGAMMLERMLGLAIEATLDAAKGDAS